MSQPDVLVVGAGLAGLSAALAVREQGGSVVVLERAPREERGGNSRLSRSSLARSPRRSARASTSAPTRGSNISTTWRA